MPDRGCRTHASEAATVITCESAGTASAASARRSRVLLVFERSRGGLRALDRAAELARAGAELSVVTLAPQAPSSRCRGPGPGLYNCAVREEAQAELADATAQARARVADRKHVGSSSEERLRAIIDSQNRISAASLDLEAVMALVVEQARLLVDAAAGVVELLDGPEMVYTATGGAAEEFLGLRLQAATSLSGMCVALGELLYCEDAAVDPRVDRDACLRVGATSMVCVPLAHGGRVVGVLKVYDARPRAFDAQDLETLQSMSGLIAAHMAHATAFQEQLHASRHDPLTGLLNRRGFDEHLGAEAARVRRYGGQVALCTFDLDGFKSVNDRHGHGCGDKVLCAVAGHMRELRGEDAAFRLGGDEFAILLVGSSREGARLVGDRVAGAVAADPSVHGVTVSCGTAALREDDPALMVRAADEDLYAQKAGRRARSDSVASAAAGAAGHSG